MEKAGIKSKYRGMRWELGRNCGNWRNGWSSEVLEEEHREEWGCRALFITAGTLDPEALLDHSQNHTTANTEDRLSLSPSVILWLLASLSLFPVSSSLNLSASLRIIDETKEKPTDEFLETLNRSLLIKRNEGRIKT